MNQKPVSPPENVTPTDETGDMKQQNYINHIAFVIDASTSMHSHKAAVIKVADDQIAYLAKRSQQLDQETRVSVYLFADTVTCVIFDKDVLRLPSIATLYEPRGNTALIDATMQSQLDLRQTCVLYGDHSFLTYIFTDGEENWSRKFSRTQLANFMSMLQNNETVGLLVPDWRAKDHAMKFGFHRDNIAIWDATSAQGMEEAMEVVRTATDSYMHSRTQGVKSTRSLFSMDPSTLNTATVKAAGLRELMPGKDYASYKVEQPFKIREFVEQVAGKRYQIGKAFFQLVKTEKVGDGKDVAVRHIKSGKVYSGPSARQLLKLPDVGEVRIAPDHNMEYQVFIQSTSNNRNLPIGSDLLIMLK